MIIQRELSDPRLRGFPSITRVQVADDLSAADVYVTIMGSQGQQTAALHALQHSAGLMRTRLTKALTIRQVPFIRFHMDEDLKRELELLGLLAKVAAENAESDRRRDEQAQARQEAAEPKEADQEPGEQGQH